MFFRILFAFILIAPLLSFIAWAYFYVKKAQKGSVRPFSNDTPRPPGESLRLKIEDLNWDAISHFTILWLMAVFGCLILFQSPSSNSGSVELWKAYLSIGVIIGCSVGALLAARKLRIIMVDLRAYNLGYDGERHVGQALNRLMLKGYVVYHDLVFEQAGKSFNIDHVVIGESGVFAIETKTRRKPLSQKDGPQYRVGYDGRILNFPNGKSRQPIEQALANAKFLSEWLSGRIGKFVSAEAIIVIPGWWIDATTQKPVVVMNDKGIENFRFRSSQRVDETLLKQIDFVLKQENAESLN